jgi:hypothetical protein
VPLHDVGSGNTKSATKYVPLSLQTKYIERHFCQILVPFVESFSNKGWDFSFFKQESATAHTAHNSMPALRIVFSDRIISRPLWHTLGTLSSSVCSFYRSCEPENGLSHCDEGVYAVRERCDENTVQIPTPCHILENILYDLI